MPVQEGRGEPKTAVQACTQGREAEGAGAWLPPRSLSFVPSVPQGNRGCAEPPSTYSGRSPALRVKDLLQPQRGRAPLRRSPSPPAAPRAAERRENVRAALAILSSGAERRRGGGCRVRARPERAERAAQPLSGAVTSPPPLRRAPCQGRAG